MRAPMRLAYAGHMCSGGLGTERADVPGSDGDRDSLGLSVTAPENSSDSLNWSHR